ncbi:MAG TPA: serine/threonine-protein kinase [Micromonosporaceae bacterium]|jgi:serine/threonine-protein kinase
MREDRALGGRYRLVEQLGIGGMSVVWRGFDEVLGRQVAVKVLASQLAAAAPLRERLRAEAQAAARLSHPNITSVYDYGEASVDGGPPVPYVVMELVDGESLATHLANAAALPWRTAVTVGAEVAAALAAAHARGIVHRDVTPANVMLTAAGAKVVDFGISALIGETDAGPDGSLLGTPAYLAPERLDGGPVSAATDVYALGLLLYRALTGHLPWRVATTTQMLRAHRYAEPGPLPSVAGLPDEVGALCGRCLSKSPHDRPTSAEVAAALAEVAGVPLPVSPAGVPVSPAGVPVSPAAPRSTAGGISTAGWPSVPQTTILPGQGAGSAAPLGLSTRAMRRSRSEAALIAAGLLLATGLVWAFTGPSSPQGRDVLAAPRAEAAAGGGAAPPTCRVEYRTDLDTGQAFSAELTVSNAGSRPIDDWSLTFDLPGDQRLIRASSTGMVQSGHTVVAMPAPADARLAPGASARLVLVGTYQAANPLPLAFALNGDTCQAVVHGASTGGVGAGTGRTGATSARPAATDNGGEGDGKPGHRERGGSGKGPKGGG